MYQGGLCRHMDGPHDTTSPSSAIVTPQLACRRRIMPQHLHLDGIRRSRSPKA